MFITCHRNQTQSSPVHLSLLLPCKCFTSWTETNIFIFIFIHKVPCAWYFIYFIIFFRLILCSLRIFLMFCYFFLSCSVLKTLSFSLHLSSLPLFISLCLPFTFSHLATPIMIFNKVNIKLTASKLTASKYFPSKISLPPITAFDSSCETGHLQVSFFLGFCPF